MTDRSTAQLPKTLLITHFPPSFKNGSIHHIMAAVERFADALVWYTTKPPADDETFDLPVPHAAGHVPSRPSRPPWKALRLHATLGPWAAHLGRRAAAFGRRHDVELVWTQLSLETVVAGRVAAKRLGVPLVVSALDDPPTLLDYQPEFLDWTRRVFRRDFERTIRAARAHGVISSAMARDYAERYGVEAKVLYVGVDPEERVEPPDLETFDAQRDAPYVVGSVGSMISNANWSLLLEAVRLIERDGVERVRVLQVGTLDERHTAPEVEVSGWVDGEAMRACLERFDVCFLSMWFDDDHAYSARTAFPTKVRTYLASGRPILAFGPADSLVVRFVEAEGVGVTCTTPDAGALAEALRSLLFDRERYRRAVERVQDAAGRLSRERYFETIEEFLRDGVRSPIDRASDSSFA